MTKKEFLETIRETEKLLIKLSNGNRDQDLDLETLGTLRKLENILDDTENSTDVYISSVGERDCLVFDKESEE